MNEHKNKICKDVVPPSIRGMIQILLKTWPNMEAKTEWKFWDLNNGS